MSSEENAEGPSSAGNAEGGLEAAQRARRELQERMEEIRQEVYADVEANWPAMWRSPDLVEAKVNARLSGHGEYQKLLQRRREVESREAGLDTEEHGGGSGDDAG